MLGCVALCCVALCLWYSLFPFTSFSLFFSFSLVAWRFLFRLFEFLYCVDLTCVCFSLCFFLFDLQLFHMVLGCSSVVQLLEWVCASMCTYVRGLWLCLFTLFKTFSRICSHYFTALITAWCVVACFFFSRANSFNFVVVFLFHFVSSVIFNFIWILSLTLKCTIMLIVVHVYFLYFSTLLLLLLMMSQVSMLLLCWSRFRISGKINKQTEIFYIFGYIRATQYKSNKWAGN